MVKLDKNKISEIFINPTNISLDETVAFGKLAKKYPYFQIAKIVELYGLKKHNSLDLKKSIQDCALLTSNRTILREIVEFNQLIKYKKEVLLSDQKTKNTFLKWLSKTNFESNYDDNLSNSLIEKFIESKPSVNLKNKSSEKNLANEFEITEKQYMTETLAKKYVEQEKFNEAIQAYEILCLKYPEKISLFAIQIKELKNKL